MKVSIFDLDRTLVKKTASFSFYFHLLANKILPKRTLFKIVPLYFKARFGKLSIQDLHHEVFEIALRGNLLSVFIEEAKKFLDGWLEKQIHPVVYDRFIKAKAVGERTFLLSSSPDFIVREIASRLGFDEWRGTEYNVDKEGRLCEIASLIEGKAKLMWAKKIPCLSSVVYTDSEDDRPLLEWADQAVVVQPSLSLKRLALANNWEVIR